MKRAAVDLVVAMDRDGCIGRDGKLPWHLPEDLRRFKALTMGKPVVMGRRTFESIGRPLPGRVNIVLSRRPVWSAPGVQVARTPEEALALAGDAPEVSVIGGAAVYAAFLPRARRIHLTLVDAQVGGDVFFPRVDEAEWRVVSREDRPADARNAHPLSFRVLERRGVPAGR